MAKEHIRSIRISDDMAALIEQQAGNNFTEKWENLVTRCVWELPHKEEKLRKLDLLIAYKEQELKELEQTYQRIDEMKAILDDSRFYLEELSKEIKKSKTKKIPTV